MQFGELLYAGHESLRRDFESSCDEADAIVALARKAGATGARLTGGGWGGVVIVLAPERSADRVVARIQEGFAKQYGRIPQAVGGEGERWGEDRALRRCRLQVASPDGETGRRRGLKIR